MRATSSGEDGREEARSTLRRVKMSSKDTVVEPPPPSPMEGRRGTVHVGGELAVRTPKAVLRDRGRRSSVAALSMFMEPRMKPQSSGDSFSAPAAAVGEGVVRPVMVQFFERVSAAIDESRLAEEEENFDKDQVLQDLQETLTHGSNFVNLAGLTMTATFELGDPRVEKLIGAAVPTSVRKIVIVELIKAIDRLWERFGLLLVDKYHSFERAFKYLDEDNSGYVDREEFTHAYVETLTKSVADGNATGFTGGGVEEAPVLASSSSGMGRTTSGRGLLKRSNTSVGGSMQADASVWDRTSQVGRNGTRGSLSAPPASVNRINRTILRGEAEFLFDMLRAGEEKERGLAQADADSDQEIRVSMRVLVMRLTGLNHKVMEGLRAKLVTQFSSLQGAFDQFAKARGAELRVDEFEKMYRHLNRADAEMAPSPPTALASGSSGPPSFSNSPAPTASDTHLGETARRIFNSIDIDGSGRMAIDELRKALASFGPSTSFTIFRRRLVLQWGSFEQFFLLHPPKIWRMEDRIEALSFDLHLNATDGRSFMQRLCSGGDDEKGPAAWKLPADGYSVEEFAIAVFMKKAEDATIEDLLVKRGGPTDRDKEIPFREFAERIITCEAEVGPPAAQSQGAADAASRRSAANGRAIVRSATLMSLSGKPKPSPSGKSRRSLALGQALPSEKVTAALPITCRLQDAKTVYHTLEREHQRVTINILLHAMTNVSDYLALDRTAYQSGDCIFCRVRLSPDALKRCKERPFVAVVPERLEWNGAKSTWLLDGERVTDLAQFCGRVYELPRTSMGVPLREVGLRIMAPFVVASTDRYEVRLLSSSNGREPGRQVGRSVAFSLLMPAPSPPLVDQVALNAVTGEGSAVLHWSAPSLHFEGSPVLNFVVKVEPLMYTHSLVVEKEDNAPEDDAGPDAGYKEVVVWSPALKAFTKKLSYGVTGLTRGVQYRFGVQCVHAGSDKAAVHGAASEMSEVVAMPLHHVTDAPGVPQASLGPNGLQLVWAPPSCESIDEMNRICTYLVQYRHARAKDRGSRSSTGLLEDVASSTGRSGGSKESAGSGDMASSNGGLSDMDSDSDDSVSISDDEAEDGWVDVPETIVYISQPNRNEFKGWEVPCFIVDLEPIDGERDDQKHEFRICAVNNAGNSPWSRPSEAIRLKVPRPEAGRNTVTVPAPVQALEVVALQGHGPCGEARREPRSQCVLRWRPPPTQLGGGEALRYAVFVKDVTNSRGEGSWQPVSAYFQRGDRGGSVRGSYGPGELDSGGATEAVVVGLERFSPSTRLALQVRAIGQQGSSSAEVEVPPIEPRRPPSLEEAPKVVEVLRGRTSAGVVELRWRQVPPAGPGEPPMKYVLQAARAEKVDSDEWGEEVLQWGEFAPVQEACFSTPAQDEEWVRCFAPGFPPIGLYLFRVVVVAPDGSRSEASPASSPPTDLAEVRALNRGSSRRLSAAPAAEAPSEASRGEGGAAKRPRDLRVTHTEFAWCELTWEQRVAGGKSPPISYDVQECRDDLQREGEWRGVKATYVSLEPPLPGQGDSWLVRAAVFFEERLQPGSHWRARVAAEGSEWSTPTPWQELAQVPTPSQPSAPAVLRSLQHHCVLEWTMDKRDADVGVHYELQLQAHQQRRGGKFADWVAVPFFTAQAVALEAQPLAPADYRRGAAVAVRAVVERQAIAELIRGGSAFDAVRFRARLSRKGGITGPPSEPSETVPVHFALPPPPPPAAPELASRGWILMQSPSGALHGTEFVRLRWALRAGKGPLEPPYVGAAEAQLPAVAYDVETEDAEQGFWVNMPGVLTELDRSAGMACALVPLPPQGPGPRAARFRIVACRGKGPGADPASVHSPPSPAYHWGAPVELSEPPKIIQAQPTQLAIRFSLPDLAARPGLSAITAVVEQMRPSGGRWSPSAAALPSVGTAGRLLGGGDHDPVGADLALTRDEDWECVGEFPVYWQVLASRLDEAAAQTADGVPQPLQSPRSFAAAAAARRTSGLGGPLEGEDAAQEDVQVVQMDMPPGCLCEGVVTLDAGDPRLQGALLRLRLRLQPLGGGARTSPGSAAATSPPSEPAAVVLDRPQERTAALKLVYTREAARPGSPASFRPVLFARTAAVGGQPSAPWVEEPVPFLSGAAARLRFELEGGSAGGIVSVDAGNGVVAVDKLGAGRLRTVTVQAVVTSPWRARCGAMLVPGTSATAAVSLADVHEEALDALQALLEEPAVQELRDSSPGAIGRALVENPKLLPVLGLLQACAASEAADAAVDLVTEILRMPRSAIALAGVLDRDQLLERLCGEQADVESEEEDEEEDHEERDPGSSDDFGDATDNRGEEMPIFPDCLSVKRASTSPLAEEESALPEGSRAGSFDIFLDAAEAPQRSLATSRSASKNPAESVRSSPEDLGMGTEMGPMHSDSSLLVPPRARTGKDTEPSTPRNQELRPSLLERPTPNSSAKRRSAMHRGSVRPAKGPDQRTSQAVEVPTARFIDMSQMSSSRNTPGSSNPGSDDEEDDRSKAWMAKIVGAPNQDPIRRLDGAVVRRAQTKLLEVTYPGMLPFWPAFTDVEFVPTLRCFAGPPTAKARRGLAQQPQQLLADGRHGEELPPPRPGQIRFEARPPLPASVTLDTFSGTIRGSPLMERVLGRQYTVLVRWEETNEVAAWCNLDFAVAPAEVAASCNDEYAGTGGCRAPAFAPCSGGGGGGAPGIAAGAAAEGSPHSGGGRLLPKLLPLLEGPGPAPDDSASLRENPGCGMRPPGGDALASFGVPLQPVTPPWKAGASSSRELSPGSAPRTPGGLARSPPSSRSKVGLGALFGPATPPARAGTAGAAEGRSRTNVFPLGPPLRDREPPHVEGRHSPHAADHLPKQPTSARGARPRLRALYR